MRTLTDIFVKLNEEGVHDSEIARRLDVAPSTVMRWKKIQRAPGVEYLEPIARLAHLPVEEVWLAAAAAEAQIRGKDRKLWQKVGKRLSVAGVFDHDMHYATEVLPAASRWASQLSGWVKQQLPALQAYAIWRIQTIAGVTLRAGCSRLGYSPSSRTASPGASGPMPVWTPA